MQDYVRRPLTDTTGLSPEKCPNCAAPPAEIGVIDQFDNAVTMHTEGFRFDHLCRQFRCGRCKHRWSMERVVNFKH